MEIKLTEIYDLLYSLGVTANYTGFFHTSYAVLLCVEQRERLLLVTKHLYPEVAKHYKTTPGAVERNIRAVISMIWQNSPASLSKLAGKPLLLKPRPAQFLSILSASILNGKVAFVRSP